MFLALKPRLSLAALLLSGLVACPQDDGPPVTGTPQADADTSVTPDTVTSSDTPSTPDVSVTPDTPTAPDATPDVGPPSKNPTGASLSLSLDAFAVAPGTERQVCKTINLPGDAAIDLVKIVSSMEGTSHHFNLYKVIDDNKFVPVTGADSTIHDCSPGDEQLSGDAAYIFGSATPERTFETPLGVAIQLEPGQRLILEQHVINFTPTEIQGGVDIELHAVEDPATIEHYADIMWLNWMAILLPPGQETSSGSTCTVPYDVNVIGLMSHFHELGTHFQVDRVEAGTLMETLYEDTDWAHPKYQEFTDPVLLRKGDGLKWTCTWNNYKNSFVTFGPASTDEMCITFALAYPTETKVGDPIMCNKAF